MPARTRSAIAVAAATAALLLVGGATASAACPGEDLRADEQDRAAIERALVCLVNERRAGAGLGRVSLSGQLNAAARRHSTDMVRRGFFSHTAPGRVTFVERIVATGYTRRVSSWLVGENLAWGSGELSTPSEMVASWMRSPPHRENLMRHRFREIGVSAVPGIPQDADSSSGITVSTEYGYRSGRRGLARATRARTALRGAGLRARG